MVPFVNKCIRKSNARTPWFSCSPTPPNWFLEYEEEIPPGEMEFREMYPVAASWAYKKDAEERRRVGDMGGTKQLGCWN